MIIQNHCLWLNINSLSFEVRVTTKLYREQIIWIPYLKWYTSVYVSKSEWCLHTGQIWQCFGTAYWLASVTLLSLHIDHLSSGVGMARQEQCMVWRRFSMSTFSQLLSCYVGSDHFLHQEVITSFIEGEYFRKGARGNHHHHVIGQPSFHLCETFIFSFMPWMGGNYAETDVLQRTYFLYYVGKDLHIERRNCMDRTNKSYLPYNNKPVRFPIHKKCVFIAKVLLAKVWRFALADEMSRWKAPFFNQCFKYGHGKVIMYTATFCVLNDNS